MFMQGGGYRLYISVSGTRCPAHVEYFYILSGGTELDFTNKNVEKRIQVWKSQTLIKKICIICSP